MKITDMIISSMLKKGVLYEGRNTEMEIVFPLSNTDDKGETKESNIKMTIKCDHMTVKFEKE